ncbi:MAG: adenylate/guanylate cyclase domain-containing protein, partial [Eudoraea sp.]|nr:adenylate/guanylate cyclase domain-containing protein [Eudoraea sp.]
MSETSKLSTILFADIAGYTALMQENEAQALQFLEIFKKEIENSVPKFDGQIVQYFGDGCLLSFESTSNAVRCAMDVQTNFQEQQVPVRIGIHLGEVVFKANNVFGDGVNVASRIESMGVPGGILLSKTVRDQIKNKAGFQLNSLGQFEFKNVNEALEVYVISNPGFTVPKREELKGKFKEKAQRSKKPWPALMIGLAVIAMAVWFITTSSSPVLSDEDKIKPVAVLPFENQTMENDLDAIGLMAMDWVSRGLLEGGGAIVIKRDGQDMASMEAEELTRGAELLVKGRYYSSGEDDLIITADVIDATSKNVLFSIDPLTGKKADPMELLVALQQKLIGYWKLDGEYPGRPPRYDAYEAYVKAMNTPL